MNSFGHNFRITLLGESHGIAVGIVVDGVKPGIPLTVEDFTRDMARRQGASSAGTTLRTESDTPEIISGVFNGMTTGAPVTILFKNDNTKSADYDSLLHHPRPSHADLTARVKYECYNDPRGGGMFSGRLTAGVVAAGVIAKKMVVGVTFDTVITEIGGYTGKEEQEKMIRNASDKGDSVGGVVEVTAHGIKAGIGEPLFDSVESVVAHLLFSIPGVKGVEFGAGFQAARCKGSENNDLITNANGHTCSNNDGGINGGIANGNDIVVRAAFKPTPSISLPQQTYNTKDHKVSELTIRGRHDTCIAIRGTVVVEAALAIALADLYSRQR